MFAKSMIGVCAAPLMLAAAPLSVNAQTGPPEGSLNQIGVAPCAKTRIVPSLIVLNAQGATLEGSTLTLAGAAANAIISADRPTRMAGHALTAHLLEEWCSGSCSFATDPPNATVSAFNKDGSLTKDAVVVMTSPKHEGGNLTFTVKVLEREIAGDGGPASVFIEIIGLPFPPPSYAGVARRTAARAAFYGAAAGAYYHPYAYPYRPPYPPCGYFPCSFCYRTEWRPVWKPAMPGGKTGSDA